MTNARLTRQWILAIRACGLLMAGLAVPGTIQSAQQHLKALALLERAPGLETYYDMSVAAAVLAGVFMVFWLAVASIAMFWPVRRWAALLGRFIA